MDRKLPHRSTVSHQRRFPQGSLMRSLLFLVYVNELEELPTRVLLMYADDTLLVEPVEGSSISSIFII